MTSYGGLLSRYTCIVCGIRGELHTLCNVVNYIDEDVYNRYKHHDCNNCSACIFGWIYVPLCFNHDYWLNKPVAFRRQIMNSIFNKHKDLVDSRDMFNTIDTKGYVI